MVDGHTKPDGNDPELVGLSDFVSSHAEELGGIGLSAVTNWRSRFDDFPEPVGTSKRPQFFRKSELLAWMVKHGKLPASALSSDLQPLAQAHLELEDLGIRDDDRTLALGVVAVELARAASLLTRSYRITHPSRHDEVTGGTRITPANHDAVDAPAIDTYRRLSQQQRRRITDSIKRHSTTTDSLRLEFSNGTGDHTLVDNPLTGRILLTCVRVGATVHDPCCGSGLLLSMLNKQFKDSERLRLSGQEIDPNLASAASILLAIDDNSAEIRTGSSLSGDSPRHAYDTILADPPRIAPETADQATSPSETEAIPPAEWTGRWVISVVDQLAPTGSAAVMVPPRWLMAKGGHAANVRQRLLDIGALEAVILVPTPTSTSRVGTSVALVLRGSRVEATRGVLVIDISRFHPPRTWGKASRDEKHLLNSVQRVLSEWRKPEGKDRLADLEIHDDMRFEVITELAARKGYLFDAGHGDNEGVGSKPSMESVPTPRMTIAELVPTNLVVTTGRDPAVELPPGTTHVVALETSGPMFGAVSVVPVEEIPRKSRGIAVFATTEPNDESLPLEFLAAWLSSTASREHLHALGSTGIRTTPSVAHADVLRLSADFPQLADRLRIAATWKHLDESERELRQALAQIGKERRGLL